MKEQWVLQMKSIQRDEEETSETLLDTEVLYFRNERGERVIAYEESEATGMEGSRTQLLIAPDGRITIDRTGSFQTYLVIQAGKKHFCHYGTPFGDLAVGVSAKWVHNKLTDDGGTLDFRYQVDSNSTLLSDNELHVRVRKRLTQ